MLATSDDNPLAAAVEQGVTEQNPNATLEFGETAVGMAEAPKEDEDIPEYFNPDDPSDGVSILDRFDVTSTNLTTENGTG